jgi:acetyl-CoA acetyltransferase
VSVAALQARLGLGAGRWTENDMAEVAARSRAEARSNPDAQVSGSVTAAELLARPYVAEPLRAHDCAPVGDGAAVVIIASAARARELCERPAWISGFAHQVDSGSLGARDLLAVPSAAGAAAAAGAGPVELAELHAPFSHQELLLREALGLGEGVTVNPSGGALCGNPMFAAGLARIGLAARAVMSGRASRALGHATSGPALQQNLVCVLSGEASCSSRPRCWASGRPGTGPSAPTCRSPGCAGRRRTARWLPRGWRWPTSTRSWSGRRLTCSRA